MGIAGLLPPFVKEPLKRVRADLRNYVATRTYHGTGRYCPICEKTSNRFEKYGRVPRPEARCMRCDSLERHRLLWLYIHRRTDLFDGQPKKMLHVAPEPCIEVRLRRRLGAGYLTADLMNTGAMVKMDIMDIQYPDESFDVIYCSHVLEHVPDDRKAIREFRRVLKRGGWAILLVPITAGKSHEDPSITEPAERLRVFGQEDHVRIYGPDYVDRLREAGFAVTETRVPDLVSPEDAQLMGLTQAAGEIHLCRRAPQ